MKYLKIWYEYFFRGRKVFKFVKDKVESYDFGGIKLSVQTYKVIESSKLFFPIISLTLEENIYWKPFKTYITEEALPNLTERNKNSKGLLVNVWFEVNNFSSIYGIKIIDKIKLDNALTEILNNLCNNDQKRKV